MIDNQKASFVMVTLKRRASNLFPYGHLYSFIHSVDCTAQFWCPTTEVYTFIYYFGNNHEKHHVDAKIHIKLTVTNHLKTKREDFGICLPNLNI